MKWFISKLHEHTCTCRLACKVAHISLKRLHVGSSVQSHMSKLQKLTAGQPSDRVDIGCGDKGVRGKGDREQG